MEDVNGNPENCDEPAKFGLPPLLVTQMSGAERFHSDGQQLPFSVLQFWQWSASDLASNALRGRLAEFLVGSALGIVDGVRTEWDAFDLRTAEGVTLEVKSAAYLQSWLQRKPSLIQFRIAPTRYWEAATNEYQSVAKRQAQIYVFALLAHLDKGTMDPMNVDQWQFYVLPTQVMNERLPMQKQVRLAKLLEIGAIQTDYRGLKETISAAAAE